MPMRVCACVGGSKGIGLMIAAGFVQNGKYHEERRPSTLRYGLCTGATVYIFSRKPDTAAADALDRQGAASAGRCYAMACDVSDHEQIKAVAAEIAKREHAVHVRPSA